LHWNNSKSPLSITENKASLKQLGSTNDLQTKAGWYYDKANNLLWVKAVHSNRSAIDLVIK
jgi:hypothetical protein